MWLAVARILWSEFRGTNLIVGIIKNCEFGIHMFDTYEQLKNTHRDVKNGRPKQSQLRPMKNQEFSESKINRILAEKTEKYWSLREGTEQP